MAEPEAPSSLHAVPAGLRVGAATGGRTLPARVRIRDVGPRDGVQPERPVAPADRVRLVNALVASGVGDVEVAAFVSSRAVPAMAGADEVVAGLTRPGRARYWALVPNVEGAEMALAAGVDGITITVSASEAYSQLNVRMSVNESVAAARAICALARDQGTPTDVVVSCAFGSPYEGDLRPDVVAMLGRTLLDHGATLVTYADTTGMATPRRLADVLSETGPDVGLHLHDTRGTALVNAYAAMESGVTRFDTSIGGLGGSPFAADTAGNLATEELVHLCGDLGVETRIDVEALLKASALVAELVGHPVPSRVAAAGPRSRLTSQPPRLAPEG